jgi:competence protein ComFC
MEELSELSIMENFQKPIFIPIPLSSSRLRERGFNQAELLCREILNQNINLGILIKNVLIKNKDTLHQAKIRDRSKRLRNLTGSFAIKNPEIIKSRNIILIDDVTTTGATLSEARKVLKKSGAKKVIAFTIAH